MTSIRNRRAWLVVAALLSVIPATPAFSQAGPQKPNVTVYASPT